MRLEDDPQMREKGGIDQKCLNCKKLINWNKMLQKTLKCQNQRIESSTEQMGLAIARNGDLLSKLEKSLNIISLVKSQIEKIKVSAYQVDALIEKLDDIVI